MKLKGLILTIVLAVCVQTVSAQNNQLEKYASVDEVTYLYISPSMMQTISQMKPTPDTGKGADKTLHMDFKATGVDVSAVISKLTSMQLVASKNKEAIVQLREEAGKLVSKQYEILMQMAEGGTKVVFHGIRKNDVFSDIIMVVEEKDKFILIQITGEFTMQDLQAFAAGAKNQRD